MYHSKLLKSFRILSQDDLRQIQKMLKSPFFTSNDNLQKLFKILRDKHPKLDSVQLKKEKVFVRIFPKIKYSDIKFRNLMSELLQIIERHFILQQLEKDRPMQNKFLTKALIEKGNLDLLDRQEKQLKKYIDEATFHTINFYYAKYESIQLRKQIIQSRNFNLTGELILDAKETLDSFYLFAKAKLNLELKNLSAFAAIHDEQSDENPIQENIAFQIYNDFNSLLGNNDIDLFFNIKQHYFQNLGNLDNRTQADIFSLLMNYVFQQMEIDDNKFNTIAFNLYKKGIEQQIFSNNPFLIEGHFINIAIIGGKEKEFNWTFHFIQSNEQYLTPSSKDDITKNSLSRMYFHKREYTKAIDCISHHNFTNKKYINGIKIHLIRCYYELFLQDDSYFELLIAQTNSFEKLLTRDNKASSSRIKALLNFVRFVRKLTNIRTKGKLDQKDHDYMFSLLEQQKITISRSWLLEKIDV